MSPDDGHQPTSTRDKIVRMANQIATFFLSKPHDMGVAGIAEHINKFWDPRMRRQFFEILETSGHGYLPLVVEAAGQVRRPGEKVSPEEKARLEKGPPGGHGAEGGETISRIAMSQERRS